LYGDGRRIFKGGRGIVRLLTLKARALLVAVSLVFAMSHKLGPF